MGLLSGLFGGGDSGFDEARRNIDANRGLYQQIELPKYADYLPELYDAESANYELINEDPAIKSAQLQALAKLSGLADTGLSAADEADYFKAREIGAQSAKAGTQAAIADAANRGVAGGGMEFALREIANQSGAKRAQEAGLAKAADAARQRALYNQAYAQQLGQVRGQDYSANAANAGIINQFNQANTSQRNAMSQANVDARNQAFMYNQGLKDKNYQNKLGQADRIAGLNNQQTQIAVAENAQDQARKRAMMGLAGAGAGAALGGGTGAMVGTQVGQLFY